MTLFMVVLATIRFTIPMVMITLMAVTAMTTSRPALVTIPLSAAKAMTQFLTIMAVMIPLSTIWVTVMIQSITMVTTTVIRFSLAMV